jgi:hypothetical protein
MKTNAPLLVERGVFLWALELFWALGRGGFDAVV